jgi:hypothetical protein
LAQLAVGVTHVQRGNRTGAAALLRRASARLSTVGQPAPYGVDVTHLVDFAVGLADEVDEGDVETQRLNIRLCVDR